MEKNADQSRVLHHAAAKSQVLPSVIHLTEDKVLYEDYFVNVVLLARRLSLTFVNMDDTS